MSSRIGKRNTTSGDYTITEARDTVHSKETAEWRVYYRQAMEPMSIHPNRKEALKAVARYQDGDKRRATFG